MKSRRDLEKMASQMGLKGASKQAVVEYSRGLQEGMRMAYLSVARRMLGEGSDGQSVRRFLEPLMEKEELNSLLAEIIQ